MVFQDLSLDVLVIKRVAGMKDGGFRIWKIALRVATVGQEYPMGRIWT
jgi:hypothetical protein